MATTIQEKQTSDGLAARATRNRVLARVERRLAEFLDAEHHAWSKRNPDATQLVECVARMVRSGGKRLRPAFCVTGYLAGAGDPEAPGVVDAAAALELLHTFALLHDDVMDDADLRRGEPTAHAVHGRNHRALDWRGEPRRYGESVAILAGDLALAYAERLLAGCPEPARRVWGELCTELMMGQFLDILAAARFEPDPELSTWIALFKSGRYTVYQPLAMGAQLAGADHLLDPFEEYGLAVGEAFQLRDDLLDVFGSEAATGKPSGHDVKQHKMTLLMSIALREEPEIKELAGDDITGVDGARLHAALLRSGIRDRVEAVIAEKIELAKVAAAKAPPVWSAELNRMAVEVAYRDT